MPRLSRWLVRAALLDLALGLAAGLALAARAWLPMPAWAAGLLPVYIHLLALGWATQLIFGVALWMFPKPSAEHAVRGQRAAAFAFGALNAGLALRAVGEPWLAAQPGAAASGVLTLSAVLQAAAGWAMVFSLWPRIKVK